MLKFLEFLKPPAMKMLQSPKTPKKSYTTSRAKYEFQRVHRLGKPNSTSSRPIIVRFLRFTDKEEVMSVARKELKDKFFSMYDDIPKDLYDLRKQQQKKFKQARDKGYRAHFSKAHPDQLFVNGKFLPPDQPLE